MRANQWAWDKALTGVIPPLISPLTPSGEVDPETMAALVDHVLAGGCTGLFVLGGCGEGAWLTPSQRGGVIRASVQAAGGRVPVLAGVMLPATGPATEAARQAAAEGADAVVVGSPYYFGVDGHAQRRHIEAVTAAASLPALLYNIPQCTHQVLAPGTVAMLAEDSRVLGIKDSAGDFEAFLGYLEAKPHRNGQFRVLQGHESLAAASLLQGADGLVPGLANVAPALLVTLCRAAKAGDVPGTARLQAALADLGAIYAIGHWLPALKAAAALLGLGDGRPSTPLLPADDRQRAAVAAVLSRHRLLDAASVALPATR
jgi:4-hydroxy-tetrahydrodipicolinate synthase